MSMSLLKKAVAKRLVDDLSLELNEEVNSQLDPRPSARAGQVFIAITDGIWSEGPNNTPQVLDEMLGVEVTISLKTGHIPGRVISREAVDGADDGGLNHLRRQVIQSIHGNYDLLGDADGFIKGDHSGFIAPLLFAGGDQPTPQDQSWWQGESGGPPIGISQTVRFRDARRMQDTGDMG